MSLCKPASILYLLGVVVILFLGEYGNKFAQAGVISSPTLEKFKRYSLLGLPADSNGSAGQEFTEVKFLTQLRHRRDLSERKFHIIQVERPNKPSLEIHLVKKRFMFSSFKFVVTHDDHVTETEGNETMSECQFSGTIPADPVGMAALSTCGHHAGGISGMIITSEGHFMIEPHSEHGPQIEGTITTTHVLVRLNDHAHEHEHETPHSDVLHVPPEELERAQEAERARWNITDDDETPASDEDDAESEDEDSNNNVVMSDGLDPSSAGQNDFNIETFAGKKGKDKKGGKKDTTTSAPAQASGGSSGSTAINTVEMAIFCDKPLLDVFKNKDRCPGEAKTCLTEYVMTIVHAMDMLYQQPSLANADGSNPLAYKMVYLEIQENTPINTHRGDCNGYLKTFCDYAGGKNTRNGQWDHALMLTGLDITSDGSNLVLGVAWAGTMCLQYYSCSLSEGMLFSLVQIITHEIGHSVGMDHDGDKTLTSGSCDGRKYIMSPTVGPGKVTWSTCSRKNLDDFIRTGTNNPRKRGTKPMCLRTPSKLTDSIQYATNTLPGQKYDADAQCLPYGKGCKHSASRASSMCSMLVCQSGSRIFNAHPALDGTTCAPGKKCNLGKCE